MHKFWESLIQSLEENYFAIAESLPDFLIGVFVVLLIWFLSKHLIRLIEHNLKDQLEDQLILRFIIKTSRLFVMGVAILSFLKIVGLGSVAAGIWGTAGIGAFILGFAFKDILEHFLAGFILAFNRPFRTGDIVEIIGHSGSVVGLNLRNTHIKTFDGKDVYIPNGEVIKRPLVNYTIDGFIRKEFILSIPYEVDQEEVIEMILGILTSHPSVLQNDKAPGVYIHRLHPKAIELKCMYWLNTFDQSLNAGQVELDLVDKTVKKLHVKGMLYHGNVVNIKTI